MHLFSLPLPVPTHPHPPPPLSLHQPDLSSNTLPLEQTFQRFSVSLGKAMADNAWSPLLYFPLALPTETAVST